jgi:hypothetical protein
MSDQVALLSTLTLFTAAVLGAAWIHKTNNDRIDEILSGVVKGIPVPVSQRRLLLFTSWLPYVAFLTAWLLVLGLGIVESARWVEAPEVRLICYMCAMVLFGGAIFTVVLGSLLFANMLSVIRKAS